MQSQLAPQQQPPSQQLAVLLAPACVPPKPLSANEANATENNFNMIELLVRHPHVASGPHCVNAQVMIECQKGAQPSGQRKPARLTNENNGLSRTRGADPPERCLARKETIRSAAPSTRSRGREWEYQKPAPDET